MKFVREVWVSEILLNSLPHENLQTGRRETRGSAPERGIWVVADESLIRCELRLTFGSR